MYDHVGPSHWKQCAVFDLAKWKNGLAFKNINFSLTGRPVIKIAELKAGVTEQTQFTNEDYDSSVFVSQGDMLFSWSGNPDTSIDVFRWAGPDGWLNQHIFKITPRPGVDVDFLFFTLRWLRPRFAEIARNKQTTGLGHVTIQDLRQMRVGVPPIDVQQEIVSFLKPIQAKIELNRQMNKTLEALAQALFQDWFVAFGPTRAKLEGRAPYLAPAFWALFPDQLDAAGIPAGWTMGTLQDIATLNPSESLRKGTIAPYLDMAALPTSGAISDAPTDREYTSGMRFRNGDTLLARITPCLENGKTAFVQNLPTDAVAWGSTEFIVIRPAPPVPKPYGYLLARDPAFRASTIQSMTGTSGRQRAPIEALLRYPVAISKDVVWRAFASIVEPIFQIIQSNGGQIETLAQTGDLLLLQLMSGALRLRDAEARIEAVL